METQPIALVLLFLASVFNGEDAVPILDTVSITLLLLGLHWMAMLVRYFVQCGLGARWAVVMRVLALGMACGLAIATHWQVVDNVLAILVVGLIIWFWRRSINLAESNRLDEYLISSFKIGFMVLLAVLILTLLYFSSIFVFDLQFTAMHNAAVQGLIIYFLSGLLCLSFTRISIIRRETAYRTVGSSMPDPTQLWLVVLTLFWTVVTAGAFTLETFSFGTVGGVLATLWAGFGTLMYWVIFLIAFLLNQVLRFILPSAAPSMQLPNGSSLPAIKGSPQLPQVPDYLINGIRIAVLFILLVILILVVRAILRRMRRHVDDDGEEEIRENLSMRSIMRERLKADQKSNVYVPEPLEPGTVRAYYRDLLQTLAEQDTGLAHRPTETSTEYEARLLATMKMNASNNLQAPEDGTVSDPALLNELTHAYVQERYGGKHPQLAHKAYLAEWITRFAKGLSHRSVT